MFTFSFRFTCQLAITEFNLNKDVAESVLMSSNPYQPQPTEPVIRNLNIGFAVDFETKVGKSINSLRQIESHMDHMNIDKISMDSNSHGQSGAVGTDASAIKESMLHNQQVFDTFEQCLHISDEMESVMAYYYKDEDDSKSYNFEEIFDIDNTDINFPVNLPTTPKSEESNTSTQDLSWDSYVEMKPEIEQETEDFINEILNIPDLIKHHNDTNHNTSHVETFEGVARSRSNSYKVTFEGSPRSRSNSFIGARSSTSKRLLEVSSRSRSNSNVSMLEVPSLSRSNSNVSMLDGSCRSCLKSTSQSSSLSNIDNMADVSRSNSDISTS